MKEKSFRQSMTWLHTWFGLVFVWVMYFMFVTGTLGYFDSEIDRWMMPEVPVNEDIPLEQSLRVAEAHLLEHGSGADEWYIGAVNDRESTSVYVYWGWPRELVESGEYENDHKHLDAHTGEVVDEDIRETGGGQTLYKMHYLLHYLDRDIAYKMVGVFTLLMFIGVITGIVIHRNIFKELFTFRSQKRARSWLDMHNLLSVSSLPFQIMISYSGLIFMITTFFPIIAFGGFGFDAKVAREELPKLLGDSEHVERANIPAPLIPLTSLADKLGDDISVNQIRNIHVEMPGDENARISVRVMRGVNNGIGDVIKFDGVTGERIGNDSETSSATKFSSTMLGLHEGLFAGPLLRWLYFIAGLAGSAMMATGAIYWVNKRRIKNEKQGGSFGYSLVENLNIGTIIGLLTGIAVYFWANRLLPLGMEHRPDWEVHCMFLAWLVCLIHPFLRSDKNKAWIEQCIVAALAYGLLPILNYLTTDAHLLNSIPDGNWALVGFDLTSLLTAIVLVFAAFKIRQRQQATQRRIEHTEAGLALPKALAK